MTVGTAPAVAAKKLLTADEFAHLPAPPDGSKQELVRGEVIVMSPPGFVHGWVQGQLYFALETYVRASKLGRVTVESGVLTETGPETVRGPDVAYWSFARLPLDRTPVVFSNVAPDLAVEVVSPSNSRKQIATKVREYFASGCRLVWVADPDDKTVTVYQQPGNGRVLWADATLTAEDVLPGFAHLIGDFFPELPDAGSKNP